jgi:hypothetical protein
MARFLAAPTARRLALAAAVAAALLAGGEVALRAAKLGGPVWHHPDPTLGWTLRPYAHGLEARVYTTVNAAGQRDTHHSVDKRKGVYRIAVLGDEHSEAIGVPLRGTWWWQLPVELDRCRFEQGRKIEVLNFGVAGYSTAQEAIVLETRALRYRPDLVLVQFSQGDDVRENAKALAVRPDRPFFRLEEGELRLDESFVDLRDFERRSQFRYELARELTDRSRVLQVLSKLALPVAHADGGGALAALQPPADARWEDAWRVTEALLVRMRDEAARNGAKFAVAAVPHPLERKQGVSYAAERLAAFGAKQAIAVFALPLDKGQGVAAADAAQAICAASAPRPSPSAPRP